MDLHNRAAQEYSPEDADHLNAMLAVFLPQRRHPDTIDDRRKNDPRVNLITRRQSDTATELLKPPVAMDAVHFAGANIRQLQRLRHFEIDHRPEGARIE